MLGKQARQMMQQFPHRLHAKRYFTVPARYYHRKRDFRDKPPSLTPSPLGRKNGTETGTGSRSGRGRILALRVRHDISKENYG